MTLRYSPDHRGEVLEDRFEIRSRLSVGGMSTVWVGHDRSTNAPVAVKTLRSGIEDRETAVARMRRERDAAIEHPNIVRVDAFGERADGLSYLVMELLHGRDLDQHLLKHGPSPATQVEPWLRPVAAALDTIHARGILHRDIKPENIYRQSPSGGVKLLDFGLAWMPGDEAAEGPGERLTRLGTFVGTVHFVAPEIAEGYPASSASDIYSLASVAFEMLTGLTVIEQAPPNAMLVRKVSRPAPTLSERTGREFPAEVDAVMKSALSREPRKRPRTATQFVDALLAAAG